MRVDTFALAHFAWTRSSRAGSWGCGCDRAAVAVAAPPTHLQPFFAGPSASRRSRALRWQLAFDSVSATTAVVRAGNPEAETRPPLPRAVLLPSVCARVSRAIVGHTNRRLSSRDSAEIEELLVGPTCPGLGGPTVRVPASLTIFDGAERFPGGLLARCFGFHRACVCLFLVGDAGLPLLPLLLM